MAYEKKLEEERLEAERVAAEEKKNSSNKKNTGDDDIEGIGLPTILYDQDSKELSEGNKKIIDGAIGKIKSNGDSKIILTTHSLPEGLPEFELMFSIKRAERIADYMIEQGVEKDRLILKGVGSSYPFVKKLVDEDLNKTTEVYNNRVDIKMVNASENSMINQPEVDAKYLSTKYELYQTVTEDVYFRVFVHETEMKMYKNAILRYYNDLLIEHDLSKETYRYYVGLYTDFKTAFELKRELENRNVKDAKIVAFYKGNILSNSEAELIEGEYPELVNFLQISQ